MNIVVRRSPCRALLLLVLALLSLPSRSAEGNAASATAPAADWPRLLGPAGDGRSPETGLRLDWPAAGPPVLWQVAVGEGYSAPAVARGRLFLFDRRGDRARLTALDAETGAEIWRSEYPTDYEDYYGFSNGPRASPVIDGERVYTFGAEGRLRCHAAADGKLLWEIDTARRFDVVQNFFGAGSTPIVDGALLITMVGGSPPDSPDVRTGGVRGAGSGIVAFDKLTGEVRYSVTDELASYSSPVLTDIAGRRRAFAFARGGLVGFDPRSGKVDFRFPWRAKRVESVNAANPVVDGDTVFITESYGPGGALLRVTPGGYEILRRDPPGRDGTMLAHWATPIHHQGYLYGCSGSGSGDAELRAVNLRSGELAWGKPGLGRSTVLLVEGRLIVLTEYGELLVVRATPKRYEETARVKPVSAVDGAERPLLEHPVWSPPALARGLLYARGRDRLVCFDLRRAN